MSSDKYISTYELNAGKHGYFLVYCVIYPAGNYMFKVNNRTTRARCEKCLKLTIKTPE